MSKDEDKAPKVATPPQIKKFESIAGDLAIKPGQLAVLTKQFDDMSSNPNSVVSTLEASAAHRLEQNSERSASDLSTTRLTPLTPGQVDAIKKRFADMGTEPLILTETAQQIKKFESIAGDLAMKPAQVDEFNSRQRDMLKKVFADTGGFPPSHAIMNAMHGQDARKTVNTVRDTFKQSTDKKTLNNAIKQPTPGKGR